MTTTTLKTACRDLQKATTEVVLASLEHDSARWEVAHTWATVAAAHWPFRKPYQLKRSVFVGMGGYPAYPVTVTVRPPTLQFVFGNCEGKKLELDKEFGERIFHKVRSLFEAQHVLRQKQVEQEKLTFRKWLGV